MKVKPSIRYLASGVLGIIIAGLIFYSIASWTNAQFEPEAESKCLCLVRVIDCGSYEISGIVQDSKSSPIPDAEIYILHGEEKLNSHTNNEGKFTLRRESGSCNDGPNSIIMNINAKNFKPGIFVVDLNRKEINVALEKKGF